jgi:hypothetical protein
MNTKFHTLAFVIYNGFDESLKVLVERYESVIMGKLLFKHCSLMGWSNRMAVPGFQYRGAIEP